MKMWCYYKRTKHKGNGVVKGKSLLESCRLVQDMRDGTLNLPWSGQVDKT